MYHPVSCLPRTMKPQSTSLPGTHTTYPPLSDRSHAGRNRPALSRHRGKRTDPSRKRLDQGSGVSRNNILSDPGQRYRLLRRRRRFHSRTQKKSARGSKPIRSQPGRNLRSDTLLLERYRPKIRGANRCRLGRIIRPAPSGWNASLRRIASGTDPDRSGIRSAPPGYACPCALYLQNDRKTGHHPYKGRRIVRNAPRNLRAHRTLQDSSELILIRKAKRSTLEQVISLMQHDL